MTQHRSGAQTAGSVVFRSSHKLRRAAATGEHVIHLRQPLSVVPAICLAIGITVVGYAPDACLKKWLAWHDHHGPYSAVCPIDREMDKEIAKASAEAATDSSCA
jgi:hypothetical protein